MLVQAVALAHILELAASAFKIAVCDSLRGQLHRRTICVLAVHGVYSMTATTALTIQNTLGVQDVIVTAPENVRRMIKANIEDIGCDAVKIGKVFSAGE